MAVGIVLGLRMSRGYGFIREMSPPGVVRAANFVEKFFESDDAEVVSVTHDKERYVLFYSAKDRYSSDAIFQAYRLQQQARNEVRGPKSGDGG